jgi:hypothetical protein
MLCGGILCVMQLLVQLLGYGLNHQTFDSLQGQRFFFVRCEVLVVVAMEITVLYDGDTM